MKFVQNIFVTFFSSNLLNFKKHYFSADNITLMK